MGQGWGDLIGVIKQLGDGGREMSWYVRWEIIQEGMGYDDSLEANNSLNITMTNTVLILACTFSLVFLTFAAKVTDPNHYSTETPPSPLISIFIPPIKFRIDQYPTQRSLFSDSDKIKRASQQHRISQTSTNGQPSLEDLKPEQIFSEPTEAEITSILNKDAVDSEVKTRNDNIRIFNFLNDAVSEEDVVKDILQLDNRNSYPYPQIYPQQLYPFEQDTKPFESPETETDAEFASVSNEIFVTCVWVLIILFILILSAILMKASIARVFRNCFHKTPQRSQQIDEVKHQVFQESEEKIESQF